MFRLMKLKPPHGWGAVAWELAIVTLGVLIALGAQQVVETIHWRSEMRDFRTAVKAEISDNLATYTYRKDTNRCLVARAREQRGRADSPPRSRVHEQPQPTAPVPAIARCPVLA